MRINILLVLYIFLLVCSCKKEDAKIEKLTDWVDPFIGTDYHGHTFPGAAYPFGMVQLSPDNGNSAWDWSSGYHYSDSLVAGFSHTHLSGTGIGDLADILVMPTNKEIKGDHFEYGQPYSNFYRSRYNHQNESARAGYYQILLQDDKINAELTVTDRIGFHRYAFENEKNKSIIFDLGFYINWDKPTEVHCEPRGHDMLVGYRYSTGWAGNHKVHFAAKLSIPFVNISYFCKETQKDKKDIFTKAVLNFADNAGKDILMKVAISSVDIDGAVKNLEADKNEFKFNEVRLLADSAWGKELSRIKIITPDEDKKKVFYTALYHTAIAPMLYTDVDGRYMGYKGAPMKAEGFNKYTVLSLWDTFRALKPLYTIIKPELTNDIVHSMMAQYKETGALPIWELHGNETWCMIGYHSIPVIADAILKGITTYDVEEAYEAMKKSAESNYGGLAFYREYGYIPSDKENESVSKTMEYSYDDWCIAQAAKKLSNEEEYKYYMERSQYYKNLYDPKLGFFRGKLTNGNWAEPFDPRFSRHRNDYFTEGNSFQWSWFAPHDVDGLIELYGAKDKYIAKLDQLFTDTIKVTGGEASVDISGMVGQYAHGNEPGHHTPYLYNAAGRPDKTQEMTNHIINTLYTSKPDGLPGNEDCGQLSAWYILSSIGLYPMNPTNGKFEFGSPQFEKVEIKLPKNKLFVIEAKNVSKENIYIQKVELNGQKISETYITYDQIMNGGNLVFEMSEKPSIK